VVLNEKIFFQIYFDLLPCMAASPEVITLVRYFSSIFFFSKKSTTFELGLGALDKNTIFLEFFF
jgi:hypothetical protein